MSANTVFVKQEQQEREDGRRYRRKKEERRRHRAEWITGVDSHLQTLEALCRQQQQQIEEQQQTLLQMRRELNKVGSIFTHLELRLSNVVPQLEHFRMGLQEALDEF